MDWIDELRAACARLGQKEIAKRIGYSNAVISQVLNNKYPGDLEREKAQVEGVLMKRVVDCPML
ncbi:helix-turn-helix domain-containing protein, partial [Bacillus cereus group sp. BC329]|uniref:helix-turn-helix domain-containing protein n=1 Tax=Bacillus cereus group sp. BC329 TaxID=3445307 RepID=UPI003F20A764